MIETVLMRGRAFLGRSSQQTEAELIVGPAVARLRADVRTILVECPSHDLTFDPPLGQTARRIRFPDGTMFETDNHEAVERLTGTTLGKRLSVAESFSVRLGFYVLAAAVGIYAIWKFALPFLVWAAVAMTPEPLRDAIDAGTLQAADKTIANATELSSERQDEVQKIFQDLVDQLPHEQSRDFNLTFRDVPALGPNAVALPGGTVVMTDDFVTQFPDDDVIAAVLGHELGHIVVDHGLTQL